MKIHAKYELSFCISLQVIVIPHYSYRSVHLTKDLCITLPKVSFLKLQGVCGGGGRGAPITPRGWMGVDGMDLDDR